MSKWVSGTVCAVLLGVALSAIASPALAGNGQGNGGGNGNGNDGGAAQSQPAASPGNSGAAPGQVKKDGDDAKPDNGNGNGNGASASAPASTAEPTGPSDGVKPSNSTAHNTNAAAGSNKTKKYGNGKTAGQIAIQHRYPSSGNLHGPGNSQPHKVTTCGHRHGVDVHALKSHPGGSCGTPEPPRPPHVPEPPTHSGPPVVPGAPHDPSTPPSKPAHDGGYSSTVVSTRSTSATESGALGATVEHATLPFTGFPLWAAVLAAAVLFGSGLALRRLGRARS